jgi:hypothetical protein
MEYKLFTLIIIVSFLIDQLSSKKCNIKGYSVNFIHHFLNTFINFGWLFNDKKILAGYIIFCVGVQLQFLLLGKCVITSYENKICNKTGYFKDTFYFLGMKDTPLKLNIIEMFRIIFILIAIYKLFS